LQTQRVVASTKEYLFRCKVDNLVLIINWFFS